MAATAFTPLSGPSARPQALPPLYVLNVISLRDSFANNLKCSANSSAGSLPAVLPSCGTMISRPPPRDSKPLRCYPLSNPMFSNNSTKTYTPSEQCAVFDRALGA